jgi:hypothetical protein
MKDAKEVKDTESKTESKDKVRDTKVVKNEKEKAGEKSSTEELAKKKGQSNREKARKDIYNLSLPPISQRGLNKRQQLQLRHQQQQLRHQQLQQQLQQNGRPKLKPPGEQEQGGQQPLKENEQKPKEQSQSVSKK